MRGGPASHIDQGRHSRFTARVLQRPDWTNQCPLFMTVRHIFEISEDDHPRLVTHARDI